MPLMLLYLGPLFSIVPRIRLGVLIILFCDINVSWKTLDGFLPCTNDVPSRFEQNKLVLFNIIVSKLSFPALYCVYVFSFK